MLPPDAFLDTLRLAPHEAIDLLDAAAPNDDDRGEAFRRPGVRLEVRQRAGEQARYIVFTDRLWSGGLTVLHGGYLHPGLQARVTLDAAGEARRLDAGIVHCAHLQGRIHLLELAFTDPIDETDLRVITTPQETRPKAPPVDPASLLGTVLHVERSELDHRLLLHHTARTGLTVTRAGSGAKASALLREAKVDAVLCDLDLEDTTGEELIGRMRREQYEGPVAIVTGVKSTERLKAALKAGACDVLLKPFQPERLFQALGRMLTPSGAASSSAKRAGVSGGVLEHAARIDRHSLRKCITELPQAIIDRDYDAVEVLCERLREASERLGVTTIATAAATVLETLRRSGSVVGAASELRTLIERCQQHMAVAA